MRSARGESTGKRCASIKEITLMIERAGGAAWIDMGLQNGNLMAGPEKERGGRQTAYTSANDNCVWLMGHDAYR